VTVVAFLAWAAIAALAIAGRARLQQDRVGPVAPGQGAAPLSVVVAIHDEAERVGELLRSLLAQDHPALDVIVVDDRSRDGSGEAVKRCAAGDPRVRVLRVDARPPGWQGRLWAQGVGAAEARGEWLLFLSADQRLAAPDFLRALVAELERCPDGALAALGPFTGTRWWDRYWLRPLQNAPAVVGGVLLLQRWFPHSVWLIGALGLRRATYLAMGGARAAATCGAGLFEDYGWARAFERIGRPARTIYAEALHDVSNWDEPRLAWQGLTRWVAGAITYPRGGLAIGAIFLAALAAIAGSSAAVVAQLAQAQMPALAMLALAAIGPTLGLSYCRWDRRSPWLAPLFALVSLPSLGVVLAAFWARLRNRVVWRDENLLLRVEPPPE
jgi:hypothetical protein